MRQPVGPANARAVSVRTIQVPNSKSRRPSCCAAGGPPVDGARIAVIESADRVTGARRSPLGAPMPRATRRHRDRRRARAAPWRGRRQLALDGPLGHLERGRDRAVAVPSERAGRTHRVWAASRSVLQPPTSPRSATSGCRASPSPGRTAMGGGAVVADRRRPPPDGVPQRGPPEPSPGRLLGAALVTGAPVRIRVAEDRNVVPPASRVAVEHRDQKHNRHGRPATPARLRCALDRGPPPPLQRRRCGTVCALGTTEREALGCPTE
jgi:hypothetical protein